MRKTKTYLLLMGYKVIFLWERGSGTLEKKTAFLEKKAGKRKQGKKGPAHFAGYRLFVCFSRACSLIHFSDIELALCEFIEGAFRYFSIVVKPRHFCEAIVEDA